MSFFTSFPTTDYDIYQNGQFTKVPDIFRHVAAILPKFDKAIPYQYYEIYDERPDQLSYKLYGTTDYHWTFFIINDHLSKGHLAWPMTDAQLEDHVADKYQGHTVTAYRTPTDPFEYNSISSKFPVGVQLTGSVTGAKATVVARNSQLNQLVVNFTSGSIFNESEIITSTAGNQLFAPYDVREYKNSVAYYIDSDGNKVANGNNYRLTSFKTYLEYEKLQNDSNRPIRVVRPSFISEFSSTFRRLLNG